MSSKLPRYHPSTLTTFCLLRELGRLVLEVRADEDRVEVGGAAVARLLVRDLACVYGVRVRVGVRVRGGGGGGGGVACVYGVRGDNQVT